MSRDYEPQTGQWYEDLDTEETFQVLSVDPDEEIIRIQWPDREVQGREQLVALIAGTRAMFEELTFELQVGPLVDGDLVAARWSGAGRTAGGEESAFLGHDVLRLRDGRIAEYWVVSWTGPR